MTLMQLQHDLFDPEESHNLIMARELVAYAVYADSVGAPWMVRNALDEAEYYWRRALDKPRPLWYT